VIAGDALAERSVRDFPHPGLAVATKISISNVVFIGFPSWKSATLQTVCEGR
jgi:hypothetical protein